MKQTKWILYMQRYFYFVVIIGIVSMIVLESQDVIHPVIYFFISPLIAVLVCLAFLVHRKKPIEELVSFFLFPLFLSVVLQPILYFFTTDSTTSFILQSLFLVPISNIVYVILLYKKTKMNLKSLGHLVTTVQAILFVTTIIGFLIKNPFVFDGFFIQTKMADVSHIIPVSQELAKLSLSTVIEGATQTLSIPYLFSATTIKGWVEYRNFKATYESGK